MILQQSLRCVLPSTLLFICLSTPAWSIPVPVPAKSKLDADMLEKGHKIDMANEIYRHKAGDEPNELLNDVLPADNDAAGDGQINLAHGQADQAVGAKPPFEADGIVHFREDPDDEMEMDFDHEMAKKLKDTHKDQWSTGEEFDALYLKHLQVTLAEFEKVDLEKLIPADHLDVVKMEHDGHMNKEYHKEMFLGGKHDEFKSDTVEDAQDKLKEIVEMADKNKDGKLSMNEMENWILAKMQEHFDESKTENDIVFKHLDPDGDGHIKWKEYYVHFLLSRGFDLDNSLKHVVDYGDSVQLEQDDKNALISYKFRWHDADEDPKDNKLSRDEFMAFRHPEHSKRSLEIMAQNVLRGIDTDEDGKISETEFAALPPGEVENKEYEEMDKKWQEERKKEYREMMDADHNGKVDMHELKMYLDPTNPVQAKLEAQSLLSLMDDNKDDVLSMDEIMKHSDIFISSKLVNFAANVHDEF